MQKGQIVRKQLSNGDVIGTYWIITDCKNPKLARIQSLASDKIQELIKKERLKVYVTVKMVISHRVFERIEKEVQTSIIHDSTPKWINLFKKQPELVQLRSELYEERSMIFCVEETKKIFTQYGLQIRLDLGERIL